MLTQLKKEQKVKQYHPKDRALRQSSIVGKKRPPSQGDMDNFFKNIKSNEGLSAKKFQRVEQKGPETKLFVNDAKQTKLIID